MEFLIFENSILSGLFLRNADTAIFGRKDEQITQNRRYRTKNGR